MALIGLVEIDTIPATWKLNLSSQPRAALHSIEAWGFGHGPTAVQAGVADTVGDRLTTILFIPVCQGVGIVGTKSGISSKNTISRGKGCHIGGTNSTVEVVDDSSIMRHLFEHAVRVSIVQLWRPVGTLVLLNATRGTVSCLIALPC